MKVLIVDDHPINLKLLRAQLEAEGITVIEAVDGVEGLAALGREPVDAVISDILMPNMDGYRFCYEVRRSDRFRSLPFIVYSSTYTSASDEKLARDIGADEFLRKPLPAKLLVDRLQRLTQRGEIAIEPLTTPRGLELMKQYSSQLVAKLEEQNAELRQRTIELELEVAERQAAQAALRKNQEKLTLAMHAARMGSWLSELDTGRFEADEVAMALHGFAPGETIARLEEANRHIHPDDIAEIERKFDHALKTRGTYENEYRVTHPDGGVRWLYSLGRIPEGSSFLIGLVQDITERKEAEDALKESEERLRMALVGAAAGIWEWDASAGAKWDERLYALYGFAPEEPASFGAWIERIHPEDRPRILARLDQMRDRKGDDRWLEEFRIVLPEGCVRWHSARGLAERDDRGAIRRLVGVDFDITPRKEAEAALRASEANYRTLIESASDGIFVADPDGNYLEVNSAGCQMLGYPHAELLTLKVADIVAPGELERAATTTERLKLGGVVVHELKFRRKDGSVFPGDVSSTALPDGRVLAIVRDVTERKATESALREAHDRLTKLVATTPGIVCSFRLRPDGSTSFTFGAERLEELIGLTPGTLVANALAIFSQSHPDDVERMRVKIAESARTLTPCQHEWRVRNSRGGEIWLEGHSMPLREPDGSILWQGVVTDITVRKQAEAALRESEARLRLSVEAANVGLWDWDLETNEVYYSSEWKRQIGYSVDEITNDFSEWKDRVHPQELERTLENVQRFLANPKGRYETEFRFRHRDGSYRWIYAHGDVLFGADGKPTRMLGCHIDITERRQAEETVRLSEKRLRDLIDGLGPYMFVGLMSNNGTLIEANRPALAAASLKPEDVLGKPLYETYWWSYSADVQNQLRQAIERAREGNGSRYDVKVRVKDDQFIIVDFSLQPVHDEAGNVLFIVPSANVITERKAAEEQLKATTEQLRELSARLLIAREEEGTRIAREIHDELGGAMTALKWDLEGVNTTLVSAGNGAPAAHKKILDMMDLIDTTIDTVRRISSELRPGVLDDLGLISAIEWQAQQFQQRTGITTVCNLRGDVNLSRDRAVAVFRIFQEILTNVLRHSQAKRVTIATSTENGQFTLRVSDNGRGIDKQKLLNISSLGLLGMRERAHLVGGSVHINGATGRGTTVTVMVPLE